MSWNSFVHTVSGEELSSWALQTKLCPHITVCINQVCRWLNCVQSGNDVLFVVQCLCSWTICPLKCPSMSTANHGESSNKSLHPKKELNTQDNESSYRNHLAGELLIGIIQQTTAVWSPSSLPQLLLYLRTAESVHITLKPCIPPWQETKRSMNAYNTNTSAGIFIHGFAILLHTSLGVDGVACWCMPNSGKQHPPFWCFCQVWIGHTIKTYWGKNVSAFSWPKG